MCLSQSCFQCVSRTNPDSSANSTLGFSFIITINARTMTVNAQYDLQNAKNSASAFQSRRPARLFEWGCSYEEGLAQHEQQHSKFSSLPHYCCWALIWYAAKKETSLAILPNVSPGSSAELPPQFYTGQQPTISWKWLRPTNNLWGPWAAASRLWLRASAHTETVPNIYLGNIYSSWNWWEN